MSVCMHVCKYTLMCMPCIRGSQKTAMDPLELDVQRL